MKIAIAFALVVAGLNSAAAQMWNEDMSNGARSNPNSQFVQPGATLRPIVGIRAAPQIADDRVRV